MIRNEHWNEEKEVNEEIILFNPYFKLKEQDFIDWLKLNTIWIFLFEINYT